MAEMRLVIAGAGGRMGRTLVKAAAATEGVAVVGALEGPASPVLGEDAGVLAGLPASGVKVTSEAAPVLARADAVVDFTVPAATVALVKLAAAAGCAHVIGTTGLEAEHEAEIRAAAQRIPIVKSGNMSVGVNLLLGLVKRVAATLDAGFDVEVLEMHHNRKVDAPSGTALMLGEAAAQGRGIDLAAHSARGRDGITGARRAGDIGFASLRGGTVVGEHRVVFAGPAERLELVHIAEDRMLFAHGALRAALWTLGRPPGLYTMNDVLGL
jgi:4-hydroxy-tetrahydrodipicolinate reductase